jgi:Uma2 family endonuclease
MGVLKETIEFYKEKKRIERQRKMLVKDSLTNGIFEEFMQKINDNPNLRVDVHFPDGTLLNMKVYEKRENHDLINGNIYEVK